MSNAASSVPRQRPSCPEPHSSALETTRTLQSLPNEILTHIAEFLVGPWHVTHVNDPTDRATFPWTEEKRRSREDVRNLCLVSKQFAQIAQPCLLRNIVVPDYATLTRLFRTLSESERLGTFVKSLDLEVAFHRGDPRHVNIDFAPLSLEQVDEIRGSLEGKIHVPTESEEYHMICYMYFKILQKTWALEVLSINMQPTREEGQTPLRIAHDFNELAERVSAAVVRSADRTLGDPPFLPMLHTLGLYGNPNQPYVEFSATILNPFLGLESLTDISCIRDNGYWTDLVLPCALGSAIGTNSPPTAITNISLFNSTCLPPDIYRICTIFPSLKLFHITTDPCRVANKIDDEEISLDNIRVGFLSDELAKLKHLEDLQLDLHYPFGINMILGRSQVLDLRALSKLRILRIPARYFMQPRQDDEEEMRMCSPDYVLPPTLESLTLWAAGSWDLPLDSWETKDYFRDAIIQFLSTLSGLSGPDGVFSNVREVSYRYGAGVPSHLRPCICSEHAMCRYHHLMFDLLHLTPSQRENDVKFHTKGVDLTSEPEYMPFYS